MTDNCIQLSLETKIHVMSQRKVILSMQMTLDGYVAGPNDEMEWMKESEDEWKDLFNDLKEADTYLLGRKMYPIYSQHWQKVLHNPGSKGSESEFAKLADKTQHIVFTNGDFKPDWKNTRVAHDVQEEIANLKKQPGENIIAWGGANFASNLIKLGLVDEIRIALNPVALGDGKALFSNVGQRSDFEFISAQPMKSGIIVLRYKAK
jgi:dihydrofolate reductase